MISTCFFSQSPKSQLGLSKYSVLKEHYTGKQFIRLSCSSKSNLCVA